jgi:hypothetical protein
MLFRGLLFIIIFTFVLKDSNIRQPVSAKKRHLGGGNSVYIRVVAVYRVKKLCSELVSTAESAQRYMVMFVKQQRTSSVLFIPVVSRQGCESHRLLSSGYQRLPPEDQAAAASPLASG